jgi:hypothetical protein
LDNGNPVVPEICRGQVHGPRKERRKRKRKRIIIIIIIIIKIIVIIRNGAKVVKYLLFNNLKIAMNFFLINAQNLK